MLNFLFDTGTVLNSIYQTSALLIQPRMLKLLHIPGSMEHHALLIHAKKESQCRLDTASFETDF